MIQVYTGNGKGKTTAALGLALRAAGAGLKVFVCQFLKGKYYCELKSLSQLKNIKVRQFGTKCFIRTAPTEKDRAGARAGLKAAEEAIAQGSCDVLILDELNVALKIGLLSLEEVLGLIKSCPQKTELVLTGRSAHPQIIRMADLVSQIQGKKHYFKKGIKARRGIEY